MLPSYQGPDGLEVLLDRLAHGNGVEIRIAGGQFLGSEGGKASGGEEALVGSLGAIVALRDLRPAAGLVDELHASSSARRGPDRSYGRGESG